MSALKQVIKNTGSGWLSIVITAALGIVSVPYLLKALGTDGYGLIAILGTIIGLSTVIDLGLRAALGQTLTELLSFKDYKAYSETISTALILYLLISFLFAAIIYLAAPSLTSMLNVTEDLTSTAISLIRFYGTSSIIISFVTPVFSAALHSHHRFDIVNIIQTITGTLSKVVIITMILFANFKIIDWAIVTLLFQLVALVLMVIAFRKTCEFINISANLFNFKRLTPLYKLGKRMYVIHLSQTISNKSDPIIVSSFSDIKAVGLYQPASIITQAIKPVVLTLTSQLYPLITKNHVAGRHEQVNKIFILSSKYTFLLASLSSAGLFFFSEVFTKLWLSPSIGDDHLIVAELIKLFVIADTIGYASSTQWPVLLGMKKLKYLGRVFVFTAFLDIALSIYLMAYMKFGITGVLYGTIIARIIRGYLINKYSLNLLKIKFTDYFKEAVFRPVLCLIATGLTAGFIVKTFNYDTWVNFSLMVGATVVAWVVFTWLLFLNTKERKTILQGNIRSLLT